MRSHFFDFLDRLGRALEWVLVLLACVAVIVLASISPANAQSSHDKAVAWCSVYHVVMGNSERAAEVRALAEDPEAVKAESAKAFRRYLHVSRESERMQYFCRELGQ